jgi:hypothetical protein
VRYKGGQSYEDSDFDGYMCLAPGPFIWLVIAYLMRAYVVLAMSMANKANRFELIDLVYPQLYWLAIDALASLPAMAVVIAYGMRKPKAGSLPRKIWKNGKALLLVSASASTLVAGANLIQTGGDHISGPILLCVAAWSIWFLMGSNRVHDTFLDFPVPADDKKDD